MQMSCAGRVLELDKPVVMGVLNVTPDSFSDAGRYLDTDAAWARAETMAAEGAAIIDVGGESTRPGAAPVSTQEQLRRVLPVLERLAGRLPVLVSVDTSDPELMRRAPDAGAHLINDVRALGAAGALEALAASNLGICLMHMRGEPATMQQDPCYQDLVPEVCAFLRQRVAACTAVGIDRARLCLDPGFGFGKRLAHNVELLRRLGQFEQLGLPLLVGLSRKSMVRALTGSEQTLPGSLALATIAVLHGARIIRAHDVAATVDAVRIASAFLEGRGVEGG
jgi:dihydropteroate synthase